MGETLSWEMVTAERLSEQTSDMECSRCEATMMERLIWEVLAVERSILEAVGEHLI